MTSEAQATRKSRQIELHQYLSLLYIQGHYQGSRKAMDGMEKTFANHTWYEF